MSIILTKAALALKNADNNFQLVKFEAHKPKKRTRPEDKTKDDTKQIHSKKLLDLKKIRHEVVKFGMAGFDGTKKEEAKIALAVSLGAKPPKREYINYKELMLKQKKEKQKKIEEKALMISRATLKTGVTKKRKGVNNDVGYLLSSYGKVQKKDLKKDDNKGKGKTKRNQNNS